MLLRHREDGTVSFEHLLSPVCKALVTTTIVSTLMPDKSIRSSRLYVSTVLPENVSSVLFMADTHNSSYLGNFVAARSQLTPAPT